MTMHSPRIPSLNWLRAFEAAGRHQSFARAAEELNVSAAAVSKQIAALEQHLGAQVFERGPHSVTLTAAGQAFLPVVHEALVTLEGSALSLFGTRSNRPVVIRAPFIFNASWLAYHLPSLRSRHPDLRIHLHATPLPAEDSPEADRIEISFGPKAPANSRRLFGERIVPVAPPETAARIVSVADLVQETLIEIGFHRTSWQALLEPHGVDLRMLRLMHTDSTQMALSLAAGGNGIALARQPVSDFLQTQFGLVPCLPNLALRGQQAFHMVECFSRAPSVGARLVRAWLQQKAGEEEARSEVPDTG